MPEARKASPLGAFAAAFARGRQPMLVLDARTLRFLDVNEAALRLYGWSKAQFLRWTVLDVRVGGGLEASRKARFHRSGLPWVGEASHRTKGGRIVDVRVFAFPIELDGRRAWLSTVAPVSKVQSLERAQLSPRPALFDTTSLSLLFKQGPQAMYVFELETLRFLAVNDAAEKMYGYSRSEFSRLRLEDIRPKEDLAKFRAALKREIRRGVSHHAGIWRHFRKDGSVMFVDVRALNVTFAGRKARLALVTDVTQARRLEEELRASERRYRELYAKTPALLHSIGPDGRIISVSDRWLEVLGYRREEVLGRRSTDFLTPSSARFAKEKILPEFYRTGRCVDVPYQMVKKDGELIDVQLSATVERDEKGRMVRSLAHITDVTQRKRGEAALEEAKAWYEALISSSRDAIESVGRDGKLIDVNPALERMTGYTRAELLSMRFQDITPPEYRSVDEAAFRKLERGQPAVQFEKEYLCKDGRRIPVALTAFSVNDQAGRRRGYAAFVRDVTEAKRAEREIHEILSRHEATLESTADGLLVVDLEGRITGFNRRFVSMWRIPEGVLEAGSDGKALRFVRSQLKRPSVFMGNVKQLYARPDEESFEVLELADGRAYERYSRPQKIGRRIVGRVWSFRDVTERRRLEKEIAETSAREQAKIGRDLHDSIGQTLTAVSLGLKALQRRVANAGAGLAEVERLESLTRLAIQQVRDVARGLLPHELQAGDVGASLRALSAGARQMFGVPCSVVVRGDTSLRDNSAAVQLYRIAQEAVNNAAKHAHTGEGVRITLDAGEKKLRLAVRDYGVGIKRMKAGPGLGIAIMEHRAASLGGTLTVRRAVGGGTEVVAECPRPGASR